MKKFLFFLTISLLFAELSFAQINAARGSKRQIINQDIETEISALKAYYLKLAGPNPVLDVSKNPGKAQLWEAITNVVQPPLNVNKFSAGYQTVASGDYSAAFNWMSNATGENSFAAGSGSTAAGYASVAMGLNAYAPGHEAHAVGWSTTASGQAATAAGRSTVASGNYAHAFGIYNKATGAGSFVGGLAADESNWSDASGKGTFLYQSVAGGSGIKTAEADYSAVLGGRNNSTASTALRSVVLGGDGQNATLPDAVYMHQLKLKPLSSMPTGLTAADAGLIVFDDFVKAFRGWNGTAWVNFH